MGIVLENRLYRGTRGIAGEIAYLPYLTSSGPKPLESVIAGGSIRRRFGVEARDLFQAARAGDAKAIEVVHEIGTALGWAVAAVTVLLDVGLIVLGGGIGQNTDLLLPRISAQAAALVPVRPEIRASALAGEASMYGAIAVALRTGRDSVEEMGSYVALTGCD
ncbi:MAG: ROK family protein [Limnochordaceae bacterium]|nr:ROK family protein [Limnochordaceae bacterium]